MECKKQHGIISYKVIFALKNNLHYKYTQQLTLSLKNVLHSNYFNFLFTYLLHSNAQCCIIKETYDKKYNCPPNPTELMRYSILLFLTLDDFH